MPIDPDQLTTHDIARHWIAKWSLEVDDPEPDYDHMLFDRDIEPSKWLAAVAVTLELIPPEDDDPDNLLGNLAAGPLEDLLAYHGSEMIDEVELLARRNPDFSYLLGGVWQNLMSDDVWKRVQAAASRRW